jgi:hypothetical protein
MNDISKQVQKTMKDLKREMSRVAHQKVAEAVAPILTALEREVGIVFDNREGKTRDQLRAEVLAAATRVEVDLEAEKVSEIVSSIVAGERPTFQPEITINGFD